MSWHRVYPTGVGSSVVWDVTTVTNIDDPFEGPDDGLACYDAEKIAVASDQEWTWADLQHAGKTIITIELWSRFYGDNDPTHGLITLDGTPTAFTAWTNAGTAPWKKITWSVSQDASSPVSLAGTVRLGAQDESHESGISALNIYYELADPASGGPFPHHLRRRHAGGLLSC